MTLGSSPRPMPTWLGFLWIQPDGVVFTKRLTRSEMSEYVMNMHWQQVVK